MPDPHACNVTADSNAVSLLERIDHRGAAAKKMASQHLQRKLAAVIFIDILFDCRCKIGFFRIKPIAQGNVFCTDIHNMQAGNDLVAVA